MLNITIYWGRPLLPRVTQEPSGVYTVLKTWRSISGIQSIMATTENVIVQVVPLKSVVLPLPAWGECSLLFPNVTLLRAQPLTSMCHLSKALM